MGGSSSLWIPFWTPTVPPFVASPSRYGALNEDQSDISRIGRSRPAPRPNPFPEPQQKLRAWKVLSRWLRDGTGWCRAFEVPDIGEDGGVIHARFRRVGSKNRMIVERPSPRLITAPQEAPNLAKRESKGCPMGRVAAKGKQVRFAEKAGRQEYIRLLRTRPTPPHLNPLLSNRTRISGKKARWAIP